MPNRRIKRVNGDSSLSATFVAMNEPPQKIVAHKAGQDKRYPLPVQMDFHPTHPFLYHNQAEISFPIFFKTENLFSPF